MSCSNSTSSSSSNSTSLNSTNSSSLNSTSSNFASSLIESSMNSSPPSADSSSIRPNAGSDQTPAPGQNAPPPSSPSSSSPSPSLASPPPDNAIPTPPASSSPPPSPPSTMEPPNASLPPPQSWPPPSSSPPPSPSPPPTPSTSSPQPPSAPPATLSSSPPPANSSPSPPSETGSPPSSSTSASSPPPPVSSSLEEFIPPPPPLTNSPPGTSADSSGSTPPSSQNATSGHGTSTTSNHTSHSIPTSSSSSSGSSSSSTGSSQSSSTSTGTIVGAAAGGILVIAFIALVFVLVRRRKKRDSNFKAPYAPAGNIAVQADGTYYGQNGQSMGYSGQSNHSHNAMQGTHSGMVSSFGSPDGHVYHGGGVHESGMIAGTKSVFNYEELMEITNGFSRQNIIGEGGFGCVYKGQLPDGRVVAVKQLKTGSGQGEREFRAEVEIISRVHHRHLVSLVGYCISEQQRLLIYEFVPNKTLDHHLHGKGMPVLEWTKRVKIALGSAKGLAYLHEDCHPKIIHRDIKSANILLDDTFEAQVADFGLAKLNNDTNTHVSTRVMGTFGYLAPEYASSGKLTDRSDVFSFGVVLLELLTGRKPVDASQPLGEESLVEWARPHLIRALEMGDFSDLVDPRLGKSYVESEIFTMIEVAAACIRHSAPKRPRMVQVVRALDSEGEMSDLTNGVKFGESMAYNSSQYSEDIMRFRRMALGGDDSMEYGTSGEHSGANPTSWKSRESSSEFTSGESETRPMKPLISGKRF